MTKEAYLLSLKGKPEELKDTWITTGAIKLNSSTKAYIKDTLFKVTDSTGTLNGALVYVKDTFYGSVDWNSATASSTEAIVGTIQGVMLPYFKVIALATEVADGEELSNPDFVPFENMSSPLSVEIDDDELTTMMIELGVPFLRYDELEYDKPTICDYMLKPALDVHYSLHPIVVEEEVGSMAGGSEFEIPFPKDAHGAVLYYVQGAGGTMSTFGSGAFSLYREQMMYGAGGGPGGFGGGVAYRKGVPGYVGIQSKDAAMQAMASAQGYANYYRREHYKKKRKDGKLYATGYSNIGGFLCAKWLTHSYNWNDIEYEYLPDVRNLAKAYILRNFGMLRNMLKDDTPGKIDFSQYTSRADTLEQKVLDKWEKQPTMSNLAIMRGGL